MRKYATCNIVISPTVRAKPTRRRMAEVNMEIMTSQTAGPQTKPAKLIIKGENFHRVMKLVALFSKTDEELAKAVRGSVLAGEVKGKTDEEVAVWARNNVRAELAEMAGETT